MRLRNICDIQMGLTVLGGPIPARSGGVTAIQIDDVKSDGCFNPRMLQKFDLGQVPEKYYAQAGDILFVSRYQRSIARVIYENWNGSAAVIAPLIRLRVDPGWVLPEYLAWIINQTSTKTYFDTWIQKSRSSLVPQFVLKELTVELPNLDRQRDIVEFDDLVKQEHRLSIQLADKKNERRTSLTLSPLNVSAGISPIHLKIVPKADDKREFQISQIVWATCNTFRDILSLGEIKDYVLPVFFLKYLSDIQKEKNCVNFNRKDRNCSTSLSRMNVGGFVLPEHACFDSLYHNRNEADIGKRLNAAFDTIAKAIHVSWKNTFRAINFDYGLGRRGLQDHNRRIRKLLEDFQQPELDFRPSLVSAATIGDCFRNLLSQFAPYVANYASSFHTPDSIASLMARLARVKVDDKICDPACGAGSLLLRTVKEAGLDKANVYGQEINGVTLALARINLFVNSIDSSQIEWCDIENQPPLLENDQPMSFDVVVSSPAFSLDDWESDLAETSPGNGYWTIGASNVRRDFGIIAHMVEIADSKKGRAIMHVPYGALFRGGTDGEIRKSMIEKNWLDAVIGLPGHISGKTGVPTAILVFDRSRQRGGNRENMKDVLFIDARTTTAYGRSADGDQSINEILQVYERREERERYSHRANIEELSRNCFDLNVPFYVDSSEPGHEFDSTDLDRDIDRIENELSKVRGMLNSNSLNS